MIEQMRTRGGIGPDEIVQALASTFQRSAWGRRSPDRHAENRLRSRQASGACYLASTVYRRSERASLIRIAKALIARVEAGERRQAGFASYDRRRALPGPKLPDRP
jgi:hypothetical protein